QHIFASMQAKPSLVSSFTRNRRSFASNGTVAIPAAPKPPLFATTHASTPRLFAPPLGATIPHACPDRPRGSRRSSPRLLCLLAQKTSHHRFRHRRDTSHQPHRGSH